MPFFSISGSDFVEMFVGVGASRVRDLFKQAKDSAPCIIFLDEIDAVGRRRGGGFTTGGHDEREQTLNAILVEMDGMNTADGVIVIAATNRPDVLDPRGYLARAASIARLSWAETGREGTDGDPARPRQEGEARPGCGPGANARATPMFSGADLAALINEAAIAATLHNKDFVEQDDLEEARDKVKFGRARQEPQVRQGREPRHRVPRGRPRRAPGNPPRRRPAAQGRRSSREGNIWPSVTTFSLPEKDRLGYSQKWLKATMRVLCGGRIAEQRASGDIASGAAMDITQVTRMARAMVLDWGMSEPRLGFVKYSIGEDTRGRSRWFPGEGILRRDRPHHRRGGSAFRG